MDKFREHIVSQIQAGESPIDSTWSNELFKEVSVQSGLLNPNLYQKVISFFGKKVMVYGFVGSIVANGILATVAFNYYKKSDSETISNPSLEITNPIINELAPSSNEETIIPLPKQVLPLETPPKTSTVNTESTPKPTPNEQSATVLPVIITDTDSLNHVPEVVPTSIINDSTYTIAEEGDVKVEKKQDSVIIKKDEGLNDFFKNQGVDPETGNPLFNK